MNVRRSVFLPLLICAGCGEPIANTSAYLEPTTANETVPVAGELCFLSTMDEPNAFVRLMAKGREGVARIRGATVRLDFEGVNLRGGGTFRSGNLTIQISNLPYAAAHSSERIAEIAVVTVTDGNVRERFSGLWTC